MQLHPLTVADAPRLSELMHHIYPPAYSYLWADDGQWYLDQQYNVPKLERELAAADSYHWMIEHNLAIVGFLKLCLRDRPGAKDQPGLYLQRLYLAPEVQGQGLGSRVMAKVYRFGQQRACRYVWLEVMEVGAARRFYERAGFVQCAYERLPYPGMHDHLRGLLTLQCQLHDQP